MSDMAEEAIARRDIPNQLLCAVCNVFMAKRAWAHGVENNGAMFVRIELEINSQRGTPPRCEQQHAVENQTLRTGQGDF